VWFSETAVNNLGAVDTTGAHFSEYPTPGNNLPDGQAEPSGIASGPDGRVWYAGFGNATVGAMTTSGTPTAFPTTALPIATTVGPDNQVWFAYLSAGKIGSITSDGLATDHVYAAGQINGVAPGPDGAMWFTWESGTGTSQIVRLPVVAPPPPVPPTPLSPVVTSTPVATPIVVTPSFTG
jgi:virginiamycin B lyase